MPLLFLLRHLSLTHINIIHFCHLSIYDCKKNKPTGKDKNLQYLLDCRAAPAMKTSRQDKQYRAP